jgi:hypothetical protein
MVEVRNWLGAKFLGHTQTLHVSDSDISAATAKRIIQTPDPPWIDVCVLGYEAQRPNLTR